MKEKTWGYGSKNPKTFEKSLNAIYSVGKTNKIKEVRYLGFNDDNTSYYTDKKVVMVNFQILNSFYLMPNGKFSIK